MRGHATAQALSFLVNYPFATTSGQGASLRNKNISKSASQLGTGHTSTTPHL